MNKFILLISLLSFVSANGQTERNAATVYEFKAPEFLKWDYPWLQNYVGDKQLKEIVSTELLKKKDGDAFYFNEKGYTVKARYKQDNWFGIFSTKSNTHEYTYNANNNVVQIKHFSKKNELLYDQTWSYYSPKQLSSSQTRRRGKPVWQTDYSYNTDSTLAKNESFSFKRGEKRLKTYYQYAYDNNRKIKTTKFYKKHKLKHTWNYACDERGKILKKDTTTICSAGGFDNKGRKIVTEYNPNHKSEVKKTVYYFYQINGRDVLSEYYSYGMRKGKEVLIYSMHEPDSLEPFRNFKMYSKKGKLTGENVVNYYAYTSALKTLKDKSWTYYTRGGRVYYERRDSFNERGLPMSAQVMGKKQKLKSKIDYVFNGDSGFTINHYKKSKLTRSYQASVSYY